MANFTPLPI